MDWRTSQCATITITGPENSNSTNHAPHIPVCALSGLKTTESHHHHHHHHKVQHQTNFSRIRSMRRCTWWCANIRLKRSAQVDNTKGGAHWTLNMQNLFSTSSRNIHGRLMEEEKSCLMLQTKDEKESSGGRRVNDTPEMEEAEEKTGSEINSCQVPNSGKRYLWYINQYQ